MSKKIISFLLAVMFVFLISSCSLFKESADTGNRRNDETAAPNTTGNEGTEESDSGTTSGGNTTGLPVIPTREPGAPMTVCIDAGHGYSDPGCTSEYLEGKYERELTAEIAEVLKEELEAAGHRVIMLRDDSHYVTVDEICSAADAIGMKYLRESLEDDNRFAPYNRTVWANVLHRETFIDILVSIHLDSYGASEDVYGTRIYYCNENSFSDKSEKLCASVADSINERVEGRKVRCYAKNWKDAYAITKRGDMPSCLIELGFVTNKNDAEAILDDGWRHDIAKAMVAGFEDYFNAQKN